MRSIVRGRDGRWSRGDQIVFRFRRRGDRVSFAIPVTVVDDSPDLIALYTAAGTPIKRPVRPDGGPILRALPYEERFSLPWRIGDGVWRENAALQLARPGTAQAIVLFWRAEDWAFRGWYVNLQAPLVRTGAGFDTEDHVLDVVVAPDLHWSWKDEDEFEAAQRIGRFIAAQAAAIRAEGETAIAAIESRGWPYDGGWDEWRPDPAWPIPTLPPTWNDD
jgi:hypothetical protein